MKIRMVNTKREPVEAVFWLSRVIPAIVSSPSQFEQDPVPGQKITGEVKIPFVFVNLAAKFIL
ncbi:MAG: hypothetical protein K6U80_07595 [Firmicutes bacterium]|nr:hypothetical protein [Bacillota bacterium]